MKRLFPGIFLILILTASLALAEYPLPDTGNPEKTGEAYMTNVNPAIRSQWIDEIIALAEDLYTKAGGRPQSAHYSGDIYVCKNFTVHLFRNTASKYRMAAYPNVSLMIPNNKKKEDCKPYAYGVEWEDKTAEDGNPFFVAATFRYDKDLDKNENLSLALAFMKNVQKGDFFQMSADYRYGVGAHSLVFTSDYDPATDLVHWTDSNMKGKTINGQRYGYVQFNAENNIDFFAEAICHKQRGATLYRLRYDITEATAQ